MKTSWTLADANAAIPEVRRLLSSARHVAAQLRDAQAHLNDLRLIHGDQVLSPAGTGHGEFARYLAVWQDARDALDDVLQGFSQLGAELKDIDAGLVDFRGTVGTRPAYLCWKEGEDHIRHWHELDRGFEGRKLLPTVAD